MKKKILITAGPTREMFDPVRFLSNLSTGEMGYALAEEAKKKYKVTLISGPTALKAPQGVRYIPIVTSSELKRACEREFKSCDILIMTAAVCDYTARFVKKSKISRKQTMHLELKQTPDIVKGLAQKKGERKVIGFCLETSDWLKRAEAKLKRKHLDGIVANFVSAKHNPFGKVKTKVALIDPENGTQMLEGLTKKAVSKKLLNWVQDLG